ncbi:hypothetical protein A2U01_0023446 [Trifolium medium]|uniref:Uncharacterized protein n=1 Tax=Trifolium medium TaxID=97028 RepID=A0A392NSN3_9FABA|nr:hypothetical protein [Trifolium medium]
MEKRSRMRVFLEFVSCCATPRHTLESSILGEDHERWLVPALTVSTASTSVSYRYRYHKKQRKGALDWRPSLGSISEDIAVAPKSAVVSREVKKKTVARGRHTKVYHRSYSDGYYGSVKKLTFLRLI